MEIVFTAHRFSCVKGNQPLGSRVTGANPVQPRGKCAEPVLQAACPCTGTPGASTYPERGRELACMRA